MRTAGLTWRVGGFTIVDGVDLCVVRGEFLSVIGPNGAGKSTLINLLSGLMPPSAGVIELNGEPVTSVGAAERVRRGIGRTFQTSSLFPQLTVRENARLAAQAAIGGSLRLSRRPRHGDAADVRANESLEEVGLAARRSETAASLPYGDRRKLEIAMVLCQKPAIVLLDEPTAGVSTEDVGPFIDVVRGLHRSGRTIVMVEHHMDLVIDASDRVAVMQDGRLIACDTPQAVMGMQVVQDAYLGSGL
jgi:branched-chain amino acid transport system ATP-binding protein